MTTSWTFTEARGASRIARKTLYGAVELVQRLIEIERFITPGTVRPKVAFAANAVPVAESSASTRTFTII